MENFTHTLLGLSMAKAGLERVTPLATTTLVISSNLPDIDKVMSLRGPFVDLHHHRGFTHSFVGLFLLAAALSFLLIYLDRKFRLRRDPFRRPIRPTRVFLVACIGGLGHTFMDFTNTYGVRPLLPFSDRWFYGDLVFIVDPWIWLILGSSIVWLTLEDSLRVFFWVAIGITASLIVALAYREPSAQMALFSPPIPTSVRVVWFTGLAIVVAGAVLGWGRAGANLARYSLFVLALYYGGMWMAHQSALKNVNGSLPAEAIVSVAAWPTPANPLLWKPVVATDQSLYTGQVSLRAPDIRWVEMERLDPKFLEAIRQSNDARVFLSFTRYAAASVNEGEDGYQVILRDLRFPLSLVADLDRDLAIISARLSWF